MRVGWTFVVALGFGLTVSGANATSLNGFLTADDGFTAYVSQDPTALGTQVATGSSFSTTYSLSGAATTLVPGVKNYLEIVATNSFGAAGFLGDFTLSDTQFQFTNGTQTLLTNDSANWTGNLQGASWSKPTGTNVNQGTNGDTTTVWYALRSPSPGSAPNIDLTAEWIWPTDGFVPEGGGVHVCPGDSAPQGTTCTVDFLAEIDPTTATTPLPATLPLFATGIGAMGLLGWRRKRKPQAA